MVKIQTSFSHGMILRISLFEIEFLGHLPQQDISLFYKVMTIGQQRMTRKDSKELKKYSSNTF